MESLWRLREMDALASYGVHPGQVLTPSHCRPNMQSQTIGILKMSIEIYQLICSLIACLYLALWEGAGVPRELRLTQNDYTQRSHGLWMIRGRC